MIKSILCALAITVAAAFTQVPRGHADGEASEAFSGERLYRDVVSYSSLGEHRTATGTDYLTHAWLAVRLKALGFDVELLPFTTRQFYPTETRVTISGKRHLEAFPVWHPTPTPAGGVTAKITADLCQVSGKLFLFDNSSASVNQTVENTIKKAAANGAKGVIVVLTAAAAPSQEIVGQNAQQLLSYDASADPGAGDQTPWPIPVVTVGRKDRPLLQTAIESALDLTVHSEGITKTSTVGFALTGTLARGPADKTLIVSTPASGWFHTAGERGTGIAAWLALAEWAAKETSGVKWVFLASSGHELNFRGTNHYLQSDQIPKPEDVYLWTHLGADLITYDYTQSADGTFTRTNKPGSQAVKYISNNPSILAALNDSFVPGNNVTAKSLNITGLQNSIAAGDLFYAKYHGYSQLLYFAGGSPLFHTRQDLPTSTGPELLEPMAKLIRDTLSQIISEL